MTLRRTAILASSVVVSALAIGAAPFPRNAGVSDCVVERVAHAPGEHHFSFHGLSPDARRLVVGFSAQSDTVLGSYLLDLRTGARTPLPGINNGGSFSPDGKRVVAAMYVSRKDTEIVELDLSSGAVTPIAPDSAYDFLPSYSPDGKLIVFNSYRSGRSDIYVHDRVTRALRRMTTFEGYDAHAQFSPDGRSIVFHRRAGKDDYNIMLLDVATGRERALTSAPGEEAYPAFSPTGREIAYVDGRDSTASTDLHVLSLKDASVRRLLTLPTYEGYPTWSRDGRFLYFTSRDSVGTRVQRVALDGSACAGGNTR